MKKVKTGIVGCGFISEIYCKNMCEVFDILDVVACADLEIDRAKSRAKAFGVPKACTTEELLADKDIELVVNLTQPYFHKEVNLAALAAGKHVHCEKPLAIDRADAEETLDFAKKRGLLVGCAPDTFMGGGVQACRAAIERGEIGAPVSGMAFMCCHGWETWHPAPEFYYQRGGGPMLDMGPYYLTALVNLLGPIKAVTGMTRITFPERTVTSVPENVRQIPVQTPTHIAGTVEFACGAIVTIVTSFDVWKSDLPFIEVHGARGSLSVPDPDRFGGPYKIAREGEEEWTTVEITTHGYRQNSRGIGPADMATAIRTGRPHRATGALAAHVLDAMLSFEESSDAGRRLELTTTCTQPAPLPEGLAEGELDG